MIVSHTLVHVCAVNACLYYITVDFHLCQIRIGNEKVNFLNILSNVNAKNPVEVGIILADRNELHLLLHRSVNLFFCFYIN